VKVLLPDKSEQTIDTGASTVEQVLLDLGINPIEVIVSRNGRLVPDDAVISGDDEIRIIRIAHGG
jgi:sulfur carrier protein